MHKIQKIKNKIMENAQKDLPPAHYEKLPGAFRDIESNPYSHPDNLIEMIRSGRYKGYWHYRLNGGYRFHYLVNDTDKTIRITYIGSHPKY